VDTRFLGRALAGAATVVWAADRAGVSWMAGRAGLAVLAVACAAAIIFGVLLAAAGFTFVTIQGSEAVDVLIYGGQYLASYPMHIYGSGLRFVFVWMVPIGLAIYAPALGVLGRQGPPGLPAWLAWLAAPGRGRLPGRRRAGLAVRHPPLRGDGLVRARRGLGNPRGVPQ